MALNKNHEFEELNGIKCGIVEKNVSPERVEFLKNLLEFNKYEVVIAPSPPPKVAAAPKPVVQPVDQPAAGSQSGVESRESGVGSQQPATSNQQPVTGNQQPAASNQQPAPSNQQPATSNQQPALNPEPVPEPPPQTFSVGVTDTTFNPINAIFGRQLKTREGNIVTLAYWQQKESQSNDDIPYFGEKSG